jgi:hypothetical protein
MGKDVWHGGSLEHFQAKWKTWRLGKCDQAEHFQAKWKTWRLGKCDQSEQ